MRKFSNLRARYFMEILRKDIIRVKVQLRELQKKDSHVNFSADAVIDFYIYHDCIIAILLQDFLCNRMKAGNRGF